MGQLPVRDCSESECDSAQSESASLSWRHLEHVPPELKSQGVPPDERDLFEKCLRDYPHASAQDLLDELQRTGM